VTKRAKIFQNGRSQAARPPKSVPCPNGLSEVSAWNEEFLKTLGSWKELIERPRSHPVARMNDPFE